MRNQKGSPPKVPASTKALAAAIVLLKVRAGEMDDKQAGFVLSASVGKQWSLITAVQYLSGKEALAPDWSEDGMTKEGLQAPTKVAAHAVANAHPKGIALCASDLAQTMKGQTQP